MRKLKYEEILKLSKSVEEKRRGVYFLISNFEIVYVGSTDDFQKRISQHISGYTKKAFDKYYFIEIKEESLIQAENEYIVLFNPKYNMRLNPSAEYITKKTALREYGLGLTFIKKNIHNIRTQTFKSEVRYNVEDLILAKNLGNTTSTNK